MRLRNSFYPIPVVVCLAIVSAALAQTYVAGAVSGVWDSTGSPYYVTGNLEIPFHMTLTINPGVEVIFQGEYYFQIGSLALLKAKGTESDSILFTTEDTTFRHQGIRFSNSADGCSLSYCVVERGNGNQIRESSVSISHSRFQMNISTDGGGIFCRDSDVFIKKSVFIDNEAIGWWGSSGGGIYCWGCNLEITDNVVSNNKAILGGGIQAYRGNTGTIKNNLITRNHSVYGGGIYGTLTEELLFDGNMVIENFADSTGGGMHLHADTRPRLVNSIFSANTAKLGGGIYAYNSNPLIINCTITENSADNLGGAAYFEHRMENILIMVNSIIRDNSAYYAEEIFNECSLFIDYCNIDTLGIHSLGTGELLFGDNNINQNPRLDGATFNLSSISPCIDRGIDTLILPFDTVFAPLYDFENETRPMGMGVDIGADESPYPSPDNLPPFFCICPSDTTIVIIDSLILPFCAFDPDGDSLFFSLIGHHCSLIGDSIFFWIPELSDTGINHFSIIASDCLLSDTCDFTIELINGRSHCGAVNGIWLHAESPHYIVCDVYVQRVDTLIIEAGVEVIFQGEYEIVVDSGAVLKALGSIADSIIFTTSDTSIWSKGIEFNRASEECELRYISMNRSRNYGLEFIETEVTISNSLIYENYDYYSMGTRGNAIYCKNSKLSMENSVIRNNQPMIRSSYPKARGGGIYAESSFVSLDSCVVDSNIITLLLSATAYGGGAYFVDCEVSIENTIFSSNEAKGGTPEEWEDGYNAYGGGIYALRSNLDLKNSKFIRNKSIGGDAGPRGWDGTDFAGGSSFGAGLYLSECILKAENCLLIENSSIYGRCGYGYGSDGKSWGGGFYLNNSPCIHKNVTFVNNYAKTHGRAFYSINSPSVLFNSVVWNTAGPNKEIEINTSSTLAVFNSVVPCSAVVLWGGSDSIWSDTNIETDPLFVDTASGDFHLQSSSPCIDAGAESVYIAIWDTVIYAPTFDIEGNPRPYAGGWDIGAYESPYYYIRESDIEKPKAMALSAFPNPFNSSITITLDGAAICHSRAGGNPDNATIEIYDVAGRWVDVLSQPVTELVEVPGGFAMSSEVNAKLPSTGSGSVYVWRPEESLPSGIYLVRATIPGNKGLKPLVSTKRVVYLK